jgi:hypothetical protein
MSLTMVTERIARRRRSSAAAQASIIPLAPRVVIGLTGQRLLIWGRTEPVTGRQVPGRGVPGRHRSVHCTNHRIGLANDAIYLANEPAVTVKVPAVTADRLTAALSGHADVNVSTRNPVCIRSLTGKIVNLDLAK